jgi:hypothetical protein
MKWGTRFGIAGLLVGACVAFMPRPVMAIDQAPGGAPSPFQVVVPSGPPSIRVESLGPDSQPIISVFHPATIDERVKVAKYAREQGDCRSFWGIVEGLKSPNIPAGEQQRARREAAKLQREGCRARGVRTTNIRSAGTTNPVIQSITTINPVTGSPTVSLARGALSFALGGGVAHYQSPTTHYFGFEDPVTGKQQLGIFAPDGNVTGPYVTGSLRFGSVPNVFVGRPPASVEVGFSAARFSSDTVLPVIDPNGQRLLIMGTGVDPFGPGLNIGPGAGDFNLVEGVHHTRKINRFNFHVETKIPTVFSRRNRATISWLVRAEIDHEDVTENLTANLPNVPLNIQYAQDINVNTFTPAVGVQIDVPVTANFDVFAKGFVGPEFINASGTDRFNFTGVVNGDQLNSLSAGKTGLAWEVSGGATILINGNELSLIGSYARNNSGVTVFRSGEAGDRSHVVFEDQEFWTALLRYQREFLPPPP